MRTIDVKIDPEAHPDARFVATIRGFALIDGRGPTETEAIKRLIHRARNTQRDLALFQAALAEVAQMEVEDRT